MRKFQVGDVVQIVNHQRLPWRLDRYRDSSRVEFIEVIGFSDREYRICIHENSGMEQLIRRLVVGFTALQLASFALETIAGYQFGLSELSESEVEIKRTMMSNCDRRVLLADSAKFGNIGRFRLCGVEEVDNLVTDSTNRVDWSSYASLKNPPLFVPGL